MMMIPLLKYLFRHAGVIPICSPRQCEATYEQAFESIHQALANEELVCIFPEGRLTPNGELGEFRPGIDKILARDPVPVIPMALNGLWGSYFSHHGGHALSTRPKRFWSKISVRLADVISGTEANRHQLRERVETMLSES